MGRAKLKMEMISNEKSRNLTFKKRKYGLFKKLHEFTTLCDVDACMVIYHNTCVDIWPQNRDEVRRIIGLYKAKKSGNYNNKTCGLSDFFQERQRKAEEQLSKMKKNNMEAKYPVWDDFFNFLTESQLRQFAIGLNNKFESVKSRIEFLKTMKNNNLTDNFYVPYSSSFFDEWAYDDYMPPPGQFYPPPPSFYPPPYGYMPPYQQYPQPYQSMMPPPPPPRPSGGDQSSYQQKGPSVSSQHP